MEKVGIVIIGAGIVGLSVAAELSRRKDSIYLLERHDSFGRETSSRNSEVIHAGIYYPKDSLKAKTCIEGKRLIYEACARHKIICHRLGKLIVATEHKEIPDLEMLFDNAAGNGVEEIELVPKETIRRLEPNVSALAGIYSNTTGVVDSHNLMNFYASQARQNGVSITYKAEVKKIRRAGACYEVTVFDASNEEFSFMAEVVINCAGLQSDVVAEMAGISEEGYRLRYCKGQYFRLSAKKSSLVKRLIYPVPRPAAGALGIHATPDITGLVRLGPDDEYVERHDATYDVAEGARTGFYKSCRTFLPFIEEDDLTPDTAGIRPKLQGPGEPFRDFIIQEETSRGFPGLINLIGIESPGLTAAPSIAKLVSSMVSSL